jgi:hypothetical protein
VIAVQKKVIAVQKAVVAALMEAAAVNAINMNLMGALRIS